MSASASTVIFLLLLILCAFVGCKDSGKTGLAPGQYPPALTLFDMQGQPASLESFKGKAIILNFWASWCAPCVAEMPELEALHQEFAPRGFSVVAVAVEDNIEDIRKVIKRFQLSIPILLDRSGESKQKFHLVGFPESFVLDAQGKFAMIIDPDTSQPALRVIGPREWSKEPARSIIGALLPPIS